MMGTRVTDMGRSTTAAAAVAFLLLVGSGGNAFAQTVPNRPPGEASGPSVVVRASGDAGVTSFTASRSFDAVLGSSTGAAFGGGAEVILPGNFSIGVRISRVRETGERVFVSTPGLQVFPLGIETEVTILPVETTFSYRLNRSRVVPYVGAGIGWHRYTETSAVADADENVEESFVGYHALGGLEIRLGRWVGLAAEVQWTTVPDALTGGVGTAFCEDDLGGTSGRVKFVIGGQ